MEYVAVLSTIALGLFLGWAEARRYSRSRRERRLVEARIVHTRSPGARRRSR
jgi:positive regulator of sigma E activity